MGNNRKLSASAIVVKDGKVLLCKRPFQKRYLAIIYIEK